MSTCRQLWRAASLATLALAGLAASHAWAAEAVGRLATYDKAPGESYFALSVMPKVAPAAQQANDVVVLFDTSASQAGVFRDDGLAALDSLLAGLGPNDRVHLMAVDVNAVPMNEGFVRAGSPEMQAALAKLRQRVPLGATDLDAGLRAAATSLTSSKAAKTVIYMGDGMSKANLPNTESFGALVGDLTKDRVSVSSFAIGKEHNLQILAALANQTGGVLATDAQEAQAAISAGKMLAGSIHGSVIWPTAVAMPASIGETFPRQTPPLRTDRDSIVIGKLAGTEAGDVKISGEMNGQPIELVAKIAPEKSNEDFAFLPRLIEVAQADGGLSLPTLGSAGLRQAAAVTMTSAEQLAKLGHDALAAGNVTGATQAATAALARDPKNPEAIAVREAAKKMAATGKAPAPKNTEPELRLTGLNQPAAAAAPPADGSLLAEVLAEKPGFLQDVETQRQVVAGKIQAEVENGLSAANKLSRTNPAQAEQDLKVMMENIERAVELDPEVRRQLREQVENAIRYARQQALVVSERVRQAQETAAAAAELQRINDELAIQQQRIAQIMARFNALMEERRYTVAVQEVIPEIERLAPNTVLASAVDTGGRFQRSYNELTDVWRRRKEGWLAGLYQVELSFIPFSDEPPIVYPDSEWWEKISIDRIAKYGSMDLLKPDSREQDIFNALKSPTDIEFVETPLKDAIEFLAEKHEIPIVLNAKKLEEAGVNIDTPVTKRLKGITLRSALRLMLGELELTYMVKDEVLQITTPEDAESPDNMVTKVYNVGDLVVPIQNNSMFGIGGLGGGMGGMMGGGFGGGMGGMGGGMGGMGGGMGGGMF
jgi:von Willebrand factor type A domain